MDIFDDEEAPECFVSWMRPQNATAYLELPSAPVTTGPKDSSWLAFTDEESAACEQAWRALSEEERRDIEESAVANSMAGGELAVDEEDVELHDDKVGVSIAKDKLFEIDVKSLTLKPIYWKMNSPPIRVRRAIWMYDENTPVPKNLSDSLEQAYHLVKPWKPAYEIELSTAFELGSEAHAKLKQPLSDNSSVLFQDATTARIISNSLTSRFFSSWRPGTSSTTRTPTTYYPGSTLVYRGLKAVQAVKKATQTPTHKSTHSTSSVEVMVESPSSSPETEPPPVSAPDGSKSDAPSTEEKLTTTPSETPENTDVTDLILIIHGIGQGLAAQYEHFNFVYAANLFRQVAKKQSATPALASIIRDRRIQFLPVQWRTSLRLNTDEETARRESGWDNEYSLEDITIKNNVTFARDLMNNVLIDIPYFMSRHREQMISAVVKQANRLYRSWCARNPEFDKKGRVHIIAHSLGSALVAHILSAQPTTQLPLSEMEPEIRIDKGEKEFLFNTSSLFLVGSPLPLFLHINRAPLIARKGTERTKNSTPDEALDKEGVFGCLAVDSIYNVFYPADPVAYLLNPAVDAVKAKELPPSIIRNSNSALFMSLSSRVSRMFEGVLRPTSPGSRSPSRPATKREVSGYELGGPPDVPQGTKAERRFAALNPHGTIDFSLPSEALSEYVDMITAHSNYWADPNFAAFVLAEIYARKEDLARTGLGFEHPGYNANG